MSAAVQSGIPFGVKFAYPWRRNHIGSDRQCLLPPNIASFYILLLVDMFLKISN
jgi:hypothetical protein